MNFKKYLVLDELLKLSQKSDEIIRNTFSNVTICDSFFEETKNKIRQILNSNCSPKKHPRSVARQNGKSGLKSRLKISFRPLLEYRAHVHVKNKDQSLGTQVRNSSNEPSLSSDVTSKESSGSSLTSSSTSTVKETQSEIGHQNDDSVIEIKNDSVIEVSSSCESNSKGCLNSNGVSENTDRLASDRSNGKISFCQMKSDSQTVQSPQLTPDRKIQNCEGGKTYVVKGKKFNISYSDYKNLSNSGSSTLNRRGREAKAEKDSSAAWRKTLENSPSRGVFDKACVIISDSSKEKSPGENCKTPPNFLTSSFNVDMQLKIKGCLRRGKRKKCTGTFTEFNKENIPEKALEDEIPVQLNKRRKCQEFENHNGSKVSLKVVENNVKSTSGYRLRSLEKKCKETKDIIGDPGENHLQYTPPHRYSEHGNASSDFSGNRLLQSNELPNSQNELVKKRNGIPLLRLGKRKLSHTDELPRDLNLESGGKTEGFGIKNSKPCRVREEIRSEYHRKVSDDKKESQRQFQTQSASAGQKKPASRKLRPSTPTEFTSANCNRQSLKVQAEEKRKRREIRVQRTKERREFLEKERKERIRLSEQRLKQKFRQHEEMLKQKTERFKIKSQNQQRRNAKRNLPSTSSKDSREDRSEDNDDSCRNVESSGQELSKESNGYHDDASLKKVDLASLEGNAGINPDISEKHNAVLEDCEKTPVEFAISHDGTELKRAGNLPLRRSGRRVKESKESLTGSHDELAQDTHLDMTKSDSKNEAVCSKPSDFMKLSNGEEKNLASPEANSFKTPKLKKMGLLKSISNKIFNKSSSEKKHNSYYFLRSAQKIHPTKNMTSNAPTSPIMDRDKNKSKNEQVCRELPSCEVIRPPSENSKIKCGNLCFKCDKNPKLQKSLETSSYNKSRQNNECWMQPIKVKGNGQNSNKGSEAKNPKHTPKTVVKKKRVTSYKISDFHNKSFDECKVDVEKIPLWATGMYLKQALIYQYYKPPNVEKIFGTPDKSVDLVDMFSRNKPEYHKRTSSEHWTLDSTPESDGVQIERIPKIANIVTFTRKHLN